MFYFGELWIHLTRTGAFLKPLILLPPRIAYNRYFLIILSSCGLGRLVVYCPHSSFLTFLLFYITACLYLNQVFNYIGGY